MTDTPDAQHELLVSLRRLADDQLVARLKSLTARERQATALLVAHLAELDTRDVYLRAGCSSLFTYCRDCLAFSDDESYSRVVAARTARRFPVVLDLLAAGELNVTTVRLLAPHLTSENHLGVLESARSKRKAQVEEIVASLSPRPDVPESLRRLPPPQAASLARGALDSSGGIAVAPGGASSASPEARSPAAFSGDSGLVAPVPGPALPAGFGAPPASAVGQGGAVSTSFERTQRCAAITPLSPGRYRYQVTISSATLEKLRLAKDMLRHALPSGEEEALLDRALTALLVELARKKFGRGQSTATSRPTAPGRRNGSSGRGTGPSGRAASSSRSPARGSGADEPRDSRHIPAAVKQAVWVRDLGRCAFLGTDGRRCAERGFLEFHHVRPYAVGGEPTLENVQLRCGPHNRYEARRYFAPEPERERLRDDRPDQGRLPRDTTGREGVPERARLSEIAGQRAGSLQVVPERPPSSRAGRERAESLDVPERLPVFGAGRQRARSESTAQISG